MSNRSIRSRTLGAMEIIVIAILAVILFGAKKLTSLARQPDSGVEEV